jgi:hypothetical protein
MNALDKLKELKADLNFEDKLEAARITLGNKLPKPPPVLQIDNLTMEPVTIATEGNISVIKGRAKTRKSFAVAMLTAAAISSDKLYNKFISTIPRKIVVYFDTEQSSFYVQEAINRVYQMSTGNGFETRFYCYGLRKFNPAERLEMIEWVFDNFKNLGLVIIDGIRDLIRDINSQDEATMITSKLLKWSENTGAHILTVLHENISDGKLRGHLGTELLNKAETVLRVEKLEDDESVSRLSCEDVRGLDFSPIYFSIDEIGIPIIVRNYEAEKHKVNLPAQFES